MNPSNPNGFPMPFGASNPGFPMMQPPTFNNMPMMVNGMNGMRNVPNMPIMPNMPTGMMPNMNGMMHAGAGLPNPMHFPMQMPPNNMSMNMNMNVNMNMNAMNPEALQMQIAQLQMQIAAQQRALQSNFTFTLPPLSQYPPATTSSIPQFTVKPAASINSNSPFHMGNEEDEFEDFTSAPAVPIHNINDDPFHGLDTPNANKPSSSTTDLLQADEEDEFELFTSAPTVPTIVQPPVSDPFPVFPSLPAESSSEIPPSSNDPFSMLSSQSTESPPKKQSSSFPGTQNTFDLLSFQPASPSDDHKQANKSKPDGNLLSSTTSRLQNIKLNNPVDLLSFADFDDKNNNNNSPKNVKMNPTSAKSLTSITATLATRVTDAFTKLNTSAKVSTGLKGSGSVTPSVFNGFSTWGDDMFAEEEDEVVVYEHATEKTEVSDDLGAPSLILPAANRSNDAEPFQFFNNSNTSSSDNTNILTSPSSITTSIPSVPTSMPSLDVVTSPIRSLAPLFPTSPVSPGNYVNPLSSPSQVDAFEEEEFEGFDSSLEASPFTTVGISNPASLTVANSSSTSTANQTKASPKESFLSKLQIGSKLNQTVKAVGNTPDLISSFFTDTPKAETGGIDNMIEPPPERFAIALKHINDQLEIAAAFLSSLAQLNLGAKTDKTLSTTLSSAIPFFDTVASLYRVALRIEQSIITNNIRVTAAYPISSLWSTIQMTATSPVFASYPVVATTLTAKTTVVDPSGGSNALHKCPFCLGSSTLEELTHVDCSKLAATLKPTKP